MEKKSLFVIGGGAAGIFCAINAARMNPQLKVTIIEKTSKLLSKVKISGGGRCNVTHACFDISEMSKKYPRGTNFVKKAFHQFFTIDTIHWFAERGVMLKEESDGRMFPVTDSSQTIIDCLLQEANQYQVAIWMQTEVTGIESKESRLEIQLSNANVLMADYICIASGGYPKDIMFEWLRKTGHSIAAPIPSLFTFNIPDHPITKLMGIAVENAAVRILGSKLQQQGPLLITHWGLSGPAVLKLSAWGARELADKKYDFSIAVHWLPQYHEQQLAELMQTYRSEKAAQKVSTKNPFLLPQRLWEFLVQQAGIQPELRWADLPARLANLLIKNLCQFEMTVHGKTTFKEEFVTAGGVALQEIDHQTMMSKKVNNLFFAGEVMDVDGVTGGFNFQHAWTSAYIAAKGITDSETE